MPISPRAMARRSRHNEEEIRLQSEIYALNQSISKSKPRKNTRMMEVLIALYDRFINQTEKKIPALQLEDIKQTFYPPTYSKAKKLLGIRSIRRDGIWYWTMPKRTPTEAIEMDYKAKIASLNDAKLELKKLDSQVCKTLRGLMEASNLCAVNTDILKEMQTRGYNRSSVLAAKAQLHIATRKVDGVWLWVWTNEEVEAWLEERVGSGRVPVVDIFTQASRDHGWHIETVKMAREAIGSIQYLWLNNKIHWYNLTQLSDKEDDMKVVMANDLMAVSSDREPITESYDFSPKNLRNSKFRGRATNNPQVISVDFTEEPEEEEDLLEGLEADEVTLPTGVKIGVFK